MREIGGDLPGKLVAERQLLYQRFSFSTPWESTEPFFKSHKNITQTAKGNKGQIASSYLDAVKAAVEIGLKMRLYV